MTHPTAEHDLIDMKWLKEGYCKTMRDWFHRRRSVEVIRDGNALDTSAKPLSMHHTMRADGKHIRLALAIQDNKFASITIVIMQCEITCTVMKLSLLRYARVIEENYAVYFVDMRIKNIL